VKHEVKQMMIEGIDKDELILLKFSIAESKIQLKWEHSKEFEYNRQMYDVVDSKIVDNTIYYWCWLDNEETKLNQQLTQLVTNLFNTNSEKKETQDRLISFYKSLYFAEKTHWVFTNTNEEHELDTFYLLSYTVVSLRPNTPPPQY
jgi:hypothetical protein